MQPAGFQIGRVVTSRCGRDRGQAYVIVGNLDQRHVLLSNGSSRPSERPKKKNIKHLIVHDKLLDSVKDESIRWALARLGEGENRAEAREGDALVCPSRM